jgi:hypothetical protein
VLCKEKQAFLSMLISHPGPDRARKKSIASGMTQIFLRYAIENGTMIIAVDFEEANLVTRVNNLNLMWAYCIIHENK